MIKTVRRIVIDKSGSRIRGALSISQMYFEHKRLFIMRIEEIKNAVVSLPVVKYRQFRDWFMEHDWEQWDKEIKIDSESGKLDSLMKEAINEKNSGKLKNP